MGPKQQSIMLFCYLSDTLSKLKGGTDSWLPSDEAHVSYLVCFRAVLIRYLYRVT